MRASSAWRTWAHPRAGGENALADETDTGHGGSSPRGRGKLFLDPEKVAVKGLIPARAGKTACSCEALTRPPAHPRAGGENHAMRVPDALADGSSPRGRGKPPHVWDAHLDCRLIPARAGKTTIQSCESLIVRAHPRAGGENWG